LGLFAKQGYEVYIPSTQISATLHFSDWTRVAEAFAVDSARMAMAAFETIEGASVATRLPKGIAWVLIRCYYAAFFAAHSIGRILGRSILRLDGAATNAIDGVTNIYGMQHHGGLQRGLYSCVADGAQKTLVLNKLLEEKSHEAFWSDFTGLLRDSVSRILTGPMAASSGRAAAKLTELELTLTNAGATAKGNWLSQTRNRVNYQHAYGVWYPYAGRLRYYDRLTDMLGDWRKAPESLSIWSQPGRELQQVVEASNLLLAICRALCQDIANRCPRGVSFQEVTTLAVLRLIKAG
jgi:hypothetical protein